MPTEQLRELAHWFVTPSPFSYFCRPGRCARCGKPKDDPIHRLRWRLLRPEGGQ